ncbi:NADP-dependent phosphogluconate dehydrogenase [Tepidibacter hydrothermalis]|uniref:6-phosphogluconate dehydrogenase, decarboxylating n=1 Tax=Tepidibacter hydrothermalis TaxID=3036126 RepID=A0ABY8EBV6_9FIRM|nr:NADP-dependent phosphogluconate dehydrogenase [Tepidibacter hydrothermalis]WFD09370.1 NADP-dependent phosphogluconate dehydrogenase [Tepidibacter hydrothermalis]
MGISDIGLFGLGVMGQSLALNIANHNYTVSAYNIKSNSTKEFIDGKGNNYTNIIPTYSIEEFINSLKKPRKIFLMIKAGKPVDDTIDILTPYMDKGDIIIDGGNSFFKDTIRRSNRLEELGMNYLGVGVSGGEEGALKGPSIMPGGTKEAWEACKEILIDISAKVNNNEACCSYIGKDGSGHYVKMVHNGIEYADMQLIAESYYLMKNLLNMSEEEMKEVFEKWNDGELQSYLIEITADILGKKDKETNKPMLDVILDIAGQKGTGKWTSKEALDLGVCTPSITEAVFARGISTIKEERVEASKKLNGPKKNIKIDKKQFIEDIRKALYASKMCAYTQGFTLLREASKEHGWELNYGEIAMLWRRGCIIRAKFLDRIKDAYVRNPKINNLLLDPYFMEQINEAQDAWRRIVSTAALSGIAVPGFSSSLNYYDAYRSENLSTNMIQAQRDYFGAHTYKRNDRDGIFHTDWMNI